MKIEKSIGQGVIGLNVYNVNLIEVRQMMEMKERIAHVLNTHCDEKLKNEYLTDEELEKILVILHVFTRDVELETKSAFTDALNELRSSKSSKVKPRLEEDIFGGDD